MSLLVCLLVRPVLAVADDARPPILRDVGIDQRLNEQVPLDLVFRDESGKTVQLGDYFGDRPVFLSLMYFRCPMLCPMILNGVVSALRTLSWNVGSEFRVLTVSIDPTDDPEAASEKKDSTLRRYSRPGASAGWHFLTGEEASIRRLADAVGFRYAYDAENQQYAHAAALIVLTPRGRVARYYYGVEYAPRDLRLGLIEASENKIGTLADQILLFCFHYDPKNGKYSLVVLNVVRLAGVITVLALGILVFVLWQQDRSRS